MVFLKFSKLGSLALTLLVAGLMSMPAYAQPGGGRDGGGRDGAGRDGGGRDGGGRQRFEDMSDEDREAMIEQFRERMAERQAEQDEQMREEIDASEEEFEVLLPKIERVRQLTRERQMATAAAGGFGRGGQGQGRGGRGGGDRGGRNPMADLFETSEEGEALMETRAELSEVLEEKAVAADVKDALDAYREARDAMDGAIAEAREDLRGLLTAQQEAYFVVNGMLD
ncbi:hypothetical protein OT109_02560 [Phycisphaeraceae bacterium D3-23]